MLIAEFYANGHYDWSLLASFFFLLSGAVQALFFVPQHRSTWVPLWLQLLLVTFHVYFVVEVFDMLR
jgi:hypothetical protein